MTDLMLCLRQARTSACRLAWARRIVQCRFERGDYSMLQELTADIREAMARALVMEVKEERA